MTPKLKSPLPPYNTWNCRWYDEKYDCARERACISRNNRMVTILTNPRQTTLSLSRTRNGLDQQPEIDSRQQRRRAHKIGRRIRCNSIRARRDCGMTRTTTTSKRRRSYQAITWFVSVHFCFFSQYTCACLYRRNLFQFSATERRAQPRVMLIGWDTFRSRLMLFLIACLLIWACIFFPLLATWISPSSCSRETSRQSARRFDTTTFNTIAHILSRLHLCVYITSNI